MRCQMLEMIVIGLQGLVGLMGLQGLVGLKGVCGIVGVFGFVSSYDDRGLQIWLGEIEVWLVMWVGIEFVGNLLLFVLFIQLL